MRAQWYGRRESAVVREGQGTAARPRYSGETKVGVRNDDTVRVRGDGFVGAR